MNGTSARLAGTPDRFARGLPWPVYLVLGLAYAAAALGWGGPVFHRVAGFTAALLLPGPALVALVGVTRSGLRDLVTGVLLSPVLLGATVAVAGLLHRPPAPGVHGVILAGALILAADAWRHRAGAVEDTDAVGLTPWWVGAGFALLVAAVLVPQEWRRITSDAWFHGAVVFEIERSGLPPRDPYFAGLPLQYFWFFHAALVAFRVAAGAAPGDTMALLNIVAVALCVPAAARVGRVLRFSRPAGVWAGVLLLLGLGGLFWIFFPIKLATALIGQDRGAAAMTRIFDIFPLTPMSTSGFVQVLGAAGFILKKFCVGTPTGWTFPLILTAAGSAMLFLRRGRRSDLALYFLSSASAVFFHLIVGGASMAALLAAAGLSMLVGTARRRAAALAGAGAAAFAVCVPYVLSLTLGSESADTAFPLGVDLRYWLALPGTVGGVFLLAWPLWKRLPRTAEHRLLLGWTVAASAYALFARLPGGNQYDKPPLIVFIPLALAAGFALPGLWARTAGRRRTLLLVFLLLFLVPENVFRWAGFAFEATPPEFAQVDHDLYGWIGDHTPRDTVFLDTKERTDVLVRGPRRQFWGIEAYATMFGYARDEMDRRRSVVDAVYGAGPLERADLAPLREVDGPVYVIAREADHPGIGERLAARTDLFTEVYAGKDVTVFAVRPEALAP